MFKTFIQQNETQMIQALQELLRFKSVKSEPENDAPFGKGIKATLEHALNLGEQMGFKTKNVDQFAGYIEYGTGKEMLGILCHLDVVPEGDHWTHDPFGGEISDGKIYGRGTLDNKGPAIASLYAMKALKDSGFEPKKRIRLILGTDEESGSNCMKYYLKHEEKPSVAFSPDADFPVIHGEMGIIIFKLKKDFVDKVPDGGIKVLSIKGGNAPNMVPDYAQAKLVSPYDLEEIVDKFNASREATLEYEKHEDHILIKSHGVSAHGSTPEKGKNAIAQLIEFLNLIEIEVGDLSSFIRFIANNIGKETDGKSLGIAVEDAYNALVLNLGMIDLNEDSGEMTINVRYPITKKELKIKAGVDSAVRGTGIEISDWFGAPPLFFKPNHPLVETLMKVYKTHTGDEKAKPITIGGGTYARAIPNAVAFGALFPGREDTMHQKDEYMQLDDFVKMTEIFASAIYELSK
ncbi:MAG: dipeptidase PepV [Clostridia bacterium]|nr:dipeptidase PepV [Clostridia bacterium]